jgi:hypothetical protein
MQRKRYTAGRAQALLADTVELIAEPSPSPAVIRRAYAKVLQAQVSDVIVSDGTREAWQKASDDDVLQSHKRIRGLMQFTTVLRAGSATGALPAFAASGVTVKPTGRGLEVAGGPFQMIVLQVLTLWRVVGPDRFAVCDCGRPFVRVGKRKYCSGRCQKRFYMRRFRAGEGGEEQQR